jgi:electron transfer flavoprotein beta subunit
VNIIILLSAGRDPRSGHPRPVRTELQAIALAHTLPHATVTGLHAGEPDPAILDAFAHGLTAITLLRQPPADDPFPALAAELARLAPDLILAGRRGMGGADTGLLPYRLAHARNVPIAADAIAITRAGPHCHITQSLPRAARRQITLTLPAIVTIHDAAPPEPPYIHRICHTGHLTERPGIPAPIAPSETRPYRPRPKLITATSPTSAGTIMTNPPPDEAAIAILDYIARFRGVKVPE